MDFGSSTKKATLWGRPFERVWERDRYFFSAFSSFFRSSRRLAMISLSLAFCSSVRILATAAWRLFDFASLGLALFLGEFLHFARRRSASSMLRLFLGETGVP